MSFAERFVQRSQAEVSSFLDDDTVKNASTVSTDPLVLRYRVDDLHGAFVDLACCLIAPSC